MVVIINYVMVATNDKVYKSYFSNLIILLFYSHSRAEGQRRSSGHRSRLRACIRASGQRFEQLLNN